MKKYQCYANYHECFEYHGNTGIERTRKKAGETIQRDWIMFDSVAEAMAFFNTECGVLTDCCDQHA